MRSALGTLDMEVGPDPTLAQEREHGCPQTSVGSSDEVKTF